MDISGQSSTITKGTVQLTRAAVAVTTIYFITFSWVMIHYTFGSLGIWWSFVINSPVQQVCTDYLKIILGLRTNFTLINMQDYQGMECSRFKLIKCLELPSMPS